MKNKKSVSPRELFYTAPCLSAPGKSMIAKQTPMKYIVRFNVDEWDQKSTSQYEAELDQ